VAAARRREHDIQIFVVVIKCNCCYCVEMICRQSDSATVLKTSKTLHIMERRHTIHRYGIWYFESTQKKGSD